MLKSLEKKLSREYGKATKEAQGKLDKYLEKFKEADATKLADMNAGKITREEYLRWRTAKMLNTKNFADMRDVLSQDFTNVNKIAAGILNNHTIDVYALNHNYGAYEICKGSNLNLSFSLYDHKTVENLMKRNPGIIPRASVNIPKDLRWNRAKLTSAITQGVLSGDSIPNIAKRLQSVSDMNRKASIRNARTYTTAAENKGRIDSYKEAEEMGIEMEQEWMSTVDMRTRPSHVEMDGERVAVGETFSNGCQYPGDPAGDPEEIYNCRCTLIAVVSGHDYDTDRFTRLPDGMTYEEWKNQ